MTTDELRKAAKNLKRSEEFLAARGRWTLESDGRSVMLDTHDTLKDMCETVEAILLYNDIPVKTDPRQTPEQVPASTFDADRLRRFASYFDRLHHWFLTHAKLEIEAGGESILGQIYGSLMAIQRSIGRFIKWSSGEEHSVEAPEESKTSRSTAPPSESAMVDRIFDGVSAEESTDSARPAASRPPQLVLAEDPSDPWYKWVSPSDIELTPSARERIFEFLAGNGVEFFRYQREKFADEVRRRIENAPEGYMLIVKVGGDESDRKPFLGYEPIEEEP
jgi:hypothetical protein